MSKSENELNGLATPTLTEIEILLFDLKPRPTARLRQMLRQAPWQSVDGEFNVVKIKRMELVVSGAALLLLVIVAGVFILNRPNPNKAIFGSGTNQNSAVSPAPAQKVDTPAPTMTAVTPEGTVLWSNRLGAASDSLMLTSFGMTYETGSENGRLFVANGYEGVQSYSSGGENLGAIVINDPATGQPVLVRDVVWNRLLWLAPPEHGLVVLTDPFQSGEYLHIVDPDSGAILNSFTGNNNIAVPIYTSPVTELPPKRLAANNEGELYLDRVFNFPAESAELPMNSLHYLLRMVIDGRILNSIAVSEEPANEQRPTAMADIVYQQATSTVYLTAYHSPTGLIQKYDLIGTPRKLATLDENLIQWQDDVALATDEQGHLYILLDSPAYMVELDQNDLVVNVYGFREQADRTRNSAVGSWLPGSMSQPLAMAVSPDGSALYIVSQADGQVILTAYAFPD